MLAVHPVRALKDNYVWLIADEDRKVAAIVDPGEAAPVVAGLARRRWRPVAILITHHHWDHVGGIAELVERYALPVFGPAAESIPHRSHGVAGAQQVALQELDLVVEALAVPGHTLGAIAYFGDGMLFSGDTFFTAGCGRLFEGTPEQMHRSLSRLAALPLSTRLYCGHEYTLANLRFAAAVEPGNADTAERLAETERLYARQAPAVPSTIEIETRTNPFLRCDAPEVRATAGRLLGRPPASAIEVFAAIRAYKDRF